MSHVFGRFSRSCLISMTASVPPKSQGLEVYFLLKGEIFRAVTWIQELELPRITPKHLLQSLAILCKMRDSLEVSASTVQQYTLIFHIIGLPIPFHFS